MKDEPLEEIWAIRRQVWDEAGRDLGSLYETYRREQEEFVRQGGKLITKPGPQLPQHGNSAIVREDPPQ